MSEFLPGNNTPIPEPWSREKRAAHEAKNWREATEALENRDGEAFRAAVEERVNFGFDEQEVSQNVVPVFFHERKRLANLHLSTYDKPSGPLTLEEVAAITLISLLYQRDSAYRSLAHPKDCGAAPDFLEVPK